MSSSFLIPMDPFEMAFRFQTEDKLQSRSVKHECREEILAQVREALQILPKRERDMLELYYFHKKDQAEIGAVFNVTQGDVSYRIARSVKRMQFYLSLHKVCMRRMARDLMKILPDQLHVTIMLGMHRTTSQTAVAKQIGLSQGKVRYRFIRSLELMEEAAQKIPVYKIYLENFEKISKNFNILRSLEVQERWKDKFED